MKLVKIMAKKEKKVLVCGNDDLKVDLWGNPSLGELSTKGTSIKKYSYENSKKRYRIKGRLLKSGRGLKPVTEIYEWPNHITKSDLRAILLKMKQSFGCGGTIKATPMSIELQGDRFYQSMDYLNELGYLLIRSGG